MKNQVRSEVPVSSSIPMFKQFARVLESAVREDGTPLKHSHALHICARLHGLPNYNTLSAKPEVRPLSWERAMDVLTSQLTQYRIPPVSRERAASTMTLRMTCDA